MLGKKSGTVAYAVVRCGGLFKGEVRHYPVPWDSLKYDVARKAYTTNLTLEDAENRFALFAQPKVRPCEPSPRLRAIRALLMSKRDRCPVRG
jgi:hypothetical protein